MPKVNEGNAYVEEGEAAMGMSRTVFLSQEGGLSQFGAYHETLKPGAVSSRRLWYAEADEFVYMLSGRLTVHEGDQTYRLVPNQSCCFKAGVPVGHYLENDTEEPAVYLVVRTETKREVVTYPDHNQIFTRDGESASWRTV